MKRDIETFVSELADYINNHIVGTDTTHIKNCVKTNDAHNRGHLIPLHLVMPDDFAGDDIKEIGPVFYAEELLNKYTNHTVAYIAEMINRDVNEHYDSFISMTKANMAAMRKPIDAYDKKDIILTAMPASQCLNMEQSSFFTKNLPDMGLICILKGYLCDNPDNENQQYYIPITNNEGKDIPDEYWKVAAKNSIRMTDIKVELTPMPEISGNTMVPIFGRIDDAASFYDYFYLLSPEFIWKRISKDTGADRVYIVPQSSHAACFILDSQKIRNDAGLSNMRDKLLKCGPRPLADQGIPMMMMDCNTFKITRYDV